MQTSASVDDTKFEYDNLSRIVKEKRYLGSSESIPEPDPYNEKTYVYDTRFTGALTSVSQDDRESSINYYYDTQGRITEKSEIFYTDEAGTQSMTIDFETEYDELGRISKSTYPSGFGVNYEYNDYGDLKALKALGQTLWQCEDVNSKGQIIKYAMADKTTQISYDNYGELNTINLSGAFMLTYGFNSFGNMSSRLNSSRYFAEDYTYDKMNRLTSSEYNYYNTPYDNLDFTIEYDSEGFGNMKSKSDVGDFEYGETIDGHTAGPHALTRINNLVDYSPPNQTITYTTFNKVESIEETLPNEDVITLDIIYGIDDQRRQSVFINDGDVNAARTKYFFGDYEEIEEGGSTTVYNYVYSPTGLCAIYEADKVTGESDILWHVNTDHLGSITYMFHEGDSASSTKEYSYTAWGLPRNPNDWSELSTNSLYSDRGYTGHEHLSEFNLINMNGRVYDPVTAKFLSPDSYVQMPSARSGFNRYSYVLNNPLIYSDPTGELVLELIGMAVGSYLNGMMYNDYEPNPLNWDYRDFGTYYSIISGGISGYSVGKSIGGYIEDRKYIIGLNEYLDFNGADYVFANNISPDIIPYEVINLNYDKLVPWEIADMYGLSLDEFASLNGGYGGMQKIYRRNDVFNVLSPESLGFVPGWPPDKTPVGVLLGLVLDQPTALQNGFVPFGGGKENKCYFNYENDVLWEWQYSGGPDTKVITLFENYSYAWSYQTGNKRWRGIYPYDQQYGTRDGGVGRFILSLLQFDN